jgi:hypothetical protein
VEDDLAGYAFSVGALILSAFGSVLTKKVTENFDKVRRADLPVGIS